MNKRLWSCMFLSLITIAGCLYATLVPQSSLPFDVANALGNGGSIGKLIVEPSSIGQPMPDGLHAGDMFDIANMDAHDRVMFTASGGNPLAGDILHLPVERDGKIVTVPVALLLDHKTGADLLVFVAYLALTWLFAALGLLLLWRGQRQAAWAVCSWCLLNVLVNVGTNIYIPLPYTGYIASLCNYLLNTGTLVALYFLADDLTRAGVAAGARRHMRRAFMLFFGIYAVLNPYLTYLAVFRGTLNNYFRGLILVHLLAFAVPLILLGLFYRHAQAADRPRIRWVWASIFVYVLSYLMSTNALLPIDFFNGIQLTIIVYALTGVAFLGFTYAVLRHRLVSLRLVLNRALVYGVITSLVVGVFAALSSLVEHFAVGKTEGALLQLLVPLSLGVTLNLIKKRLDSFVERLFFQRQYQAETALTRFIRECAFIENRETLLDRTVDEILQYLRPTGIALYERGDSSYNRLRERGERNFPVNLSGDDQALVSLRSGLAEADLDILKSGLGREGLAFPLAVRGTLMGVLVMGQRPAEQYTQSERALLARIAQQVAAALNALYAREAESFVDEIARGKFGVPPEVRSRAQALLQQALPAA